MNWKSDLIRSRAGRFFLERVAKFYDQFVCTAGAVRRQARKPRKLGTGLLFSVGIPHYNRGRLIYRPLFNLLNHPAVDEVVIVDDGSRVEEYQSLKDFVDSLEIKSGELEDLGKLGYVQGISNIFIRGLKELDETERPLHCTDKKREILYIKDNNVWERETMDKMKMKKMISVIANKNFKQIPQWKVENPMSEDNSSKKHFEYMQILCEVMSGVTPDDENGLNKIIRSVANQVYLDK
jgi:hypothetical protein